MTKKNVIKRDRHQCQYCGKKKKVMTTDHIVPKSLGGDDSWENLVCACLECNNRKGDRALREAGMNLIKKPKKPHYFTFIINELEEYKEKWRPFLFQL